MACARRVNASTMVSAILSNSGSSTRASAPAISYSMVNSMLQASAESGLKCHAAAKCRNGPFTSLSSIASPVRFSFCVVKGGRANIGEGYVMVRGEEIYLIGAHISPLPTASTHIKPDPTRTRKLLLHAEEIRRLIGKVEQRGYTLVPLNLHYSKGRIKLEMGLGRGKLNHDKRADEREKEWNREKQRLLRSK